MIQAYLPFYYEWADFLGDLSDAEYGKLVKAILAFAMGKECEVRFSPEATMAYKFITSIISRAETNRKNGQKGGIARSENMKKTPRASTNCDKIEEEGCGGDTEEEDTAENECALPTNGKNSDEFRENCEKTPTTAPNIHIEEGRNAEAAPTLPKNQGDIEDQNAKMGVPTREQVREFFKNRGFRSNPDEFFNFYESNGWKVGKNPMKSWFPSAENWELRCKRERDVGKKATEEPRRYGNFDVDEAFRLALERSYGGDDDDDEDES